MIGVLICVGAIAAALLPFSTAQAWTLKTLHSFCAKDRCTDGLAPTGPLLMDSGGNLFGITQSGGRLDEGTIYELSPAADKRKWTHKVLHPGFQPDSPLIMDIAGNLYGTTFQGGKFFYGSAYELVRPQGDSKWKWKTLHSFCPDDVCSDGRWAVGGLTYPGASTGALYDGVSPLYGSTERGGDGFVGSGTVFQLVLAQGTGKWRHKILYVFCSQQNCADGLEPSYEGLLADASGNLFGTTKANGANGAGTIFALVPNHRKTQWTESTLYSFCSVTGCADGNSGRGGLSNDGVGNLFGAASYGGGGCADVDPPGCGIIFKLEEPLGQHKYTVLYTFCQLSDCADGRYPLGNLVVDEAGTVYGTTSTGGGHDIDYYGEGGGIIFSFNGTLQVLYSFCSNANCSDGAYPSRLTRDSVGNLYGTTLEGGKYGGGTVFELSP